MQGHKKVSLYRLFGWLSWNIDWWFAGANTGIQGCRLSFVWIEGVHQQLKYQTQHARKWSLFCMRSTVMRQASVHSAQKHDNPSKLHGKNRHNSSRQGLPKYSCLPAIRRKTAGFCRVFRLFFCIFLNSDMSCSTSLGTKAFLMRLMKSYTPPRPPTSKAWWYHHAFACGAAAHPH